MGVFFQGFYAGYPQALPGAEALSRNNA